MVTNHEVEYSGLELRFERKQLQTLIRELINEGYSLYWSEGDNKFLISVRIGRKLIKFHFDKINSHYKLVGDYLIKDELLSEKIEELINQTKGHAIVKRIKGEQIVIENIMFGEIIRLVEVRGMEHRIIYQKKYFVTIEDMIKAYQSNQAEDRIKQVKLELDNQLLQYSTAIKNNDEQAKRDCEEKLQQLRLEMLQLEI